MRIRIIEINGHLVSYSSSFGAASGTWADDDIPPVVGVEYDIELTLREPTIIGINALECSPRPPAVQTLADGKVALIMTIDFVDGDMAAGRFGPDATVMCEIDEEQANLFSGCIEVKMDAEDILIFPIGIPVPRR